MATIDAGPKPQHMRALQRANEVRLARSELKRRIAEGEITAGDVLLSRPWEAATMTIAELLVAQHRWGETRARNLLGPIGMPETKTLGSFTDRQRRAMASILS